MKTKHSRGQTDGQAQFKALFFLFFPFFPLCPSIGHQKNEKGSDRYKRRRERKRGKRKKKRKKREGGGRRENLYIFAFFFLSVVWYITEECR